MSGKRVRIPHEDVHLTEDEIAITQTQTFQRLFDLKQLGLAYLVYPNATHTRGIHSIRCLGEAAKILDGLQTNGHNISEIDEQAVRVAALLHDIGHIPFSHTLEDEHEILSKHDRPKRLDKVLTLLQGELQQSQIDLLDRAKPVLYAIAEADPEEYPPSWRSDLVGNTVYADLLAYITADAEATGIEKRSGHYRIYEYFSIQKDDTGRDRLCIRLTKKGGFRSDILSAVMDLLDMRYSLTERVYFHHAKCVASAMFARASHLCGLSDEDERRLLEVGDEGFFHHLLEKAKGLSSNGQREQGDAAMRFVLRLKARRLYKRIFKVGCQSRENWDAHREETFCTKWRDPEKAEELLRSVEVHHGLPLGALALWCPPAKSGMKLAKAMIVWEQTTGIHKPILLREIGRIGNHFHRVANRIKAIEEQYADLWTFWIAIDRDYLAKTPEVVPTLERKLGLPCDPLFRETYLSEEIPDFRSRSQVLTKINDRFASFHEPVMQRLNQRALGGGDTDDDATIDQALRDVLDQETQPRRRRPDETPLFPDEEGGAVGSENKG